MSLTLGPAGIECVARVWRLGNPAQVVVSHGRIHRPEDVVGVRADDEAGLAGLVTWRRDGDEIELVTIDSFRRDAGVGRALLEHCRDQARAAGARRLWLVTTNDNLNAFGFYQHCGMTLAAARPGEVADRSRVLKPSIPERGLGGLPIRDELELEFRL